MPPLAGIFRLRGLSEEVHNRFGLPHNGNEGRKEGGPEEGETGKVDLSAFTTCWLSGERRIWHRQATAASNGPITERDRLFVVFKELKTTCNGPYKFSRGALYR